MVTSKPIDLRLVDYPSRLRDKHQWGKSSQEDDRFFVHVRTPQKKALCLHIV